MHKKNFITEYLSFTRKERTGILVMVVLILFFIILPFLLKYFTPKKTNEHAEFVKAIATLVIKQNDSSHPYTKWNVNEDNAQPYYQSVEKKYNGPKTKGELFSFDPNTLQANDWKRLGIRDKTINTITNYLAKGGRFDKPDDIRKIWGLHDDEVERLLPYIIIPQQMTAPNFEKIKNPENSNDKKKKFSITSIDINAADTTALIALPGIGSKLANRIISFREKLGGFYKVEQVAETFALPDSTYKKIKDHLRIDLKAVRQFNINTATADEMKAHPYIRYHLAGAIVQYRLQHGNFSAISDIKKIMMVTDDIYNKLAPYLSIQ